MNSIPFLKAKTMKLSVIAFIFALTLSSAWARKRNIPGESDLRKKNFAVAAKKLEKISLKGADEWYLLGRAYEGLGDKEKAHQAWTEALQIDKKNAKKKRWTFIFPPGKKLKASQKKKYKERFEADYKELNAIVSRLKTKKTRDLKNKADRTRIEADRTRVEAKRKDAKEEKLNKVAKAKTLTINDKQRMADRKARANRNRSTRGTGAMPIRPRRGTPTWVWIIVGLFVGIIIIAVLFGKRSGGGTVVHHYDDRDVRFYDVGYDDDYFTRGSFYYRGRYYGSHMDFYNQYGYYYTNRMYRDNYDRWGQGQAYDEALDHDIHEDIHEREMLYTEAAEAGYEADMMRADADHLDLDARSYEQDAHEIQQEMHDADEAADLFDDGHEFEDDVEEEELDLYGGDDEEFTDDGGYDDGGYDDGGYDDGDDGGFEDDV